MNITHTMSTRSLSIAVSSSIGKVSASTIVPQKANAIITIAHGAGAGMNHPFMVSLAELLAEAGIASLRFNFPFMEKQQRRPDTPAVAYETIEAAIRKSEKLFPSLPLFASGKSFGGRMSSQYLSEHPDSAVNGVIFFGFPLHSPGKPSIDRAEHLKKIKLPMLFLQGTRDELAKLDLIEAVCNSLRTATLVKIEGANHAFKAGKQEILPILANTAHDWMMKQIKKTNKRVAGK